MVTLNSYLQAQLQVSPGVFFLLHFDIERKGNTLLHTSAQEVNCNFSHQLNFTYMYVLHCHWSRLFQQCCLPSRIGPALLSAPKDRSRTFQKGAYCCCCFLPLENFLGRFWVWYMYALAYRRPWLLLSHMIPGGNYYSTSGAL